MCIENKDFNELLSRLDGLERRQRHIIHQLEVLDVDNMVTKVKALDKALDNLNGQNYKDLTATVTELTKIVHGDDRLGIPPLRSQVKEIYTFYDRAKWALGMLGLTNVGFILAFLMTFIKNSSP